MRFIWRGAGYGPRDEHGDDAASSRCARAGSSTMEFFWDHARGPRSRGAVGVGDVAGERGGRARAIDAAQHGRLRTPASTMSVPSVEFDDRRAMRQTPGPYAVARQAWSIERLRRSGRPRGSRSTSSSTSGDQACRAASRHGVGATAARRRLDTTSGLARSATARSWSSVFCLDQRARPSKPSGLSE